MNPQDNRFGKKGKTTLGVIVLILGIALVLVTRNTSVQSLGERSGFIFVSFGISIVIWMLYDLVSNSDVLGFILFMRKENLKAIFKDKDRGKELITQSILEWAQNSKADVIKIKGVTLNLVFGNSGVLQECLHKNQIINRETKKIQALLLNPYSMNGIARSIQESRPFIDNSNPVKAICEHTLDQHKKDILYRDFKSAAGNIGDLINNAGRHKVQIECKVYSTTSPSFLLLNSKRAISENLILGKKEDDPEGKLYGILPHLIYAKGEIKDSLESHFDYIWKYEAVPLEDFHEQVEEKYYEINRLFLLYSLQKAIWDQQWSEKSPGRSFSSQYDELYRGFKEFYPDVSPTSILDLGCGDGGGGSLTILKEHPNAHIDCIDISSEAIKIFEKNIQIEAEREKFDTRNVVLSDSDMLTFLNHCNSFQYSLVHANFSIIYMTKIKAVEIYRRIFDTLQGGGVFMLSVWTNDYFKMPIASHGQKGHRPAHAFVRIPMTEDLQVLVGGSEERKGEIRRFYRGFEELLDEFQSADEKHLMDFDNVHCREFENGAVLRVWLQKKK